MIIKSITPDNLELFENLQQIKVAQCLRSIQLLPNSPGYVEQNNNVIDEEELMKRRREWRKKVLENTLVSSGAKKMMMK